VERGVCGPDGRPRFQHLAHHDVEAALWRLACEARIDGGEIVARFFNRNARALFVRTCFFAVDSLTAREPIGLAEDVTLRRGGATALQAVADRG
jgi:hypothetical protein